MSRLYLVFDEFGRIFQIHRRLAHRTVGSGQCNAPQRISTRSIGRNVLQYLRLECRIHRDLFTFAAHVSAAVDQSIGCTFNEHFRPRFATTSCCRFLGRPRFGCYEDRHWFAITWKLEGELFLVKVLKQIWYNQGWKLELFAMDGKMDF